MKTVPSLRTLLTNTIYVSHSTQIVEETVFRKHTVFKTKKLPKLKPHNSLPP